MMIAEETIPTDTKAILLLCGHLSTNNKDSVQPLTLTEYNKFAVWLHKNELRPEDLVAPKGETRLNQYTEGKVTPARLKALLGRGVALGLAIEEWTRQGIWVLSRGESDYPILLRRNLRSSAPALLFGVGNKQLLNSGGLGIVGSRNADAQALGFAHNVVERCKSDCITVISGGAKGVDREAMIAALNARGNAIGVMPEGVAKSAVSKTYRKHIAEGRLVLISPYHPNARWSTGNAMGRNKLIYAFSNWALVVSSSTDGGTWNGAVENLKKKWVPLFVLMDTNMPQGNQKLLEMGGIAIAPQDLDNGVSLREHLRKIASDTIENDKQLMLFETNDLQVSSISKKDTEKPRRTSLPEESPILPVSVENNGIENKNGNDQNGSRNLIQVTPEVVSLDNLAPDVSRKTSNTDNQKEVIPLTTTGDLFTIVWPSLALGLPQECTMSDITDLAKQFNVQKGQMQAWLKQAVAENLLAKETKPVRYILK